MKDVSLPIEFQGLTGKVQYVQRVSAGEWSSSCPQCGGTIHKGGDLPDRFRMWTNATGKNKVFGWCRNCSYVWFPDSDKPLRPSDIEAWRKQQLEIERERKKAAEIAIKHLTSERIWEKYRDSLNEWALNDIIGKDWGISEGWAKYWQLGLIPDLTVYSKDCEPYHSPAISIPVWQFGNTIKNVKARVLNPKSSGHRYRSLYKTGIAYPFVAFGENEFDKCLIVEGEKKAMVAASRIGQEMQVIGLPTKSPNAECLQGLEKFGKIIVCLDPDAEIEDEKGNSSLKRLISFLGNDRVAVMSLSGKVDDMIVKYGLDINSAIKYAKAWR